MVCSPLTPQQKQVPDVETEPFQRLKELANGPSGLMGFQAIS